MLIQITGKIDIIFTKFTAWNIHFHQCPPPHVQEQPLQASHWPHLAVHHGAPQVKHPPKKTKNQRNGLRSSEIPSQQLQQLHTCKKLEYPYGFDFLAADTQSLCSHPAPLSWVQECQKVSQTLFWYLCKTSCIWLAHHFNDVCFQLHVSATRTLPLIC